MNNKLLCSFYFLITALSILGVSSIHAMEGTPASNEGDPRLIREVPTGLDAILAGHIAATEPAISAPELFRRYGRLFPTNLIQSIQRALIEQRRNHLIVYNGTSEAFGISGIIAAKHKRDDTGQAYITSSSLIYRYHKLKKH